MTDVTIVGMLDELAIPENLYEEWVAHPDRRRFVRARDHLLMSGQQGWWALPDSMTAEQVRQLGYKPEVLQPPKKKS